MPDEPLWKSFVWHEGRCFFVSTIERDYSTCEGRTRGLETLVWNYDWTENKKVGYPIHHAGGIVNHIAICRSLIATGKTPG